MGVFSRIKAAYSAFRYLEASVRYADGYGLGGSKARPFSPEAALRMFKSWAYAAATLNADAAAGVPKRLYVAKRKGMKSSYDFRSKSAWATAAVEGKALLYETRAVPVSTKRYLMGLGITQPSKSVIRKAIAYGGDVDEVVEPHPALQTLETVNPWQNGHELDVLRFIDVQATGNSYAHMVLDPATRMPRELWRMQPQWTYVVPGKAGSGEFITGYLYGPTPPQQKNFAPDEVIHFKSPNPKDLHYGMGWFEAAWGHLELDESKLQLDTAYNHNFARPDYAITLKNGAQPAVLDRIETKINENFRGVKKGGKFLTISGEAEFTPLNFDKKEEGTAQRVIEAIAACSHTPVAILLTNDPNRAGSETARTMWYRQGVKPLCTNDEEKLNEKYIPLFDDSGDLFIAYDHVCFEDSAAQAKEVVGYVAGGILTPNEARAAIGYAPNDGEGADDLKEPSGSAGGAAAVAGETAVNQNDRRRNED